MENGLTRAMTIAALICLLVAGAAATSILAHNAQPEPQLAAAAPNQVCRNWNYQKTMRIRGRNPPHLDGILDRLLIEPT